MKCYVFLSSLSQICKYICVQVYIYVFEQMGWYLKSCSGYLTGIWFGEIVQLSWKHHGCFHLPCCLKIYLLSASKISGIFFSKVERWYLESLRSPRSLVYVWQLKTKIFLNLNFVYNSEALHKDRWFCLKNRVYYCLILLFIKNKYALFQ